MELTIQAKVGEAKVEIIRWFFASQILLVALLAALANFTKLFGH